MEGFDPNKIFTSEEVLAGDEFVFDDHSGCCLCINYRLTEEELGWLAAVRGHYSIADFIDRNMKDGVLTADIMEMSRALDADCKGWGKAAMLSDDTALQKLFFLCYREDYGKQVRVYEIFWNDLTPEAKQRLAGLCDENDTAPITVIEREEDDDE